MINVGDVIFQIVSLIFLLGIFAVAYFLIRILIRSLNSKQNSKATNIEQRLDKIIDLLEKDKNE